MGSTLEKSTSLKNELILSHVTANDVPELAEVYMSGFERPPPRRIMYKSVPRAALVKRQESRFVKIVESQLHSSIKEEETHFLKVIDPESNEIMTLTIWTYLPYGYNCRGRPSGYGH